MANSASPLQLITEDIDIQSVFISLMRHHVQGWPKQGHQSAPVFCRHAGSAREAISLASTIWKTANLQALGVVIDAEDDPASSWRLIQNFANNHFASIPQQIPASGLIASNSMGQKFGAWIMPDNRSPGMVESFCKPTVPIAHSAICSFATSSAAQSKNHGATYKPTHFEKAELHTMLAWLDPPGQRFGEAFLKGHFDPSAASVQDFVVWSRSLFSL